MRQEHHSRHASGIRLALRIAARTGGAARLPGDQRLFARILRHGGGASALLPEEPAARPGPADPDPDACGGGRRFAHRLFRVPAVLDAFLQGGGELPYVGHAPDSRNGGRVSRERPYAAEKPGAAGAAGRLPAPRFRPGADRLHRRILHPAARTDLSQVQPPVRDRHARAADDARPARHRSHGDRLHAAGGGDGVRGDRAALRVRQAGAGGEHTQRTGRRIHGLYGAGPQELAQLLLLRLSRSVVAAAGFEPSHLRADRGQVDALPIGRSARSAARGVRTHAAERSREGRKGARSMPSRYPRQRGIACACGGADGGLLRYARLAGRPQKAIVRRPAARRPHRAPARRGEGAPGRARGEVPAGAGGVCADLCEG